VTVVVEPQVTLDHRGLAATRRLAVAATAGALVVRLGVTAAATGFARDVKLVALALGRQPGMTLNAAHALRDVGSVLERMSR
jgi:hypothetical protein